MDQQLKISNLKIEISTLEDNLNEQESLNDKQADQLMEQGQKIDKMDKELFEANHQKTLAEDAFNERIIDINKL